MTSWTLTTAVFAVVFIKAGIAVVWTDCYETTAHDYKGTTSKTWSGRECQRWDSQSPHSHSFTDPSEFPDVSLSMAKNYCRLPRDTGNSSTQRPWCYTMDPNMRWDYCYVYKCDTFNVLTGEDCFMTEPYEYNGYTYVTGNRKDCQRWDTQSPHRHTHTDPFDFPDATLSEASNFCRDPDHGKLSSRPWCYTTDPNTRWQYCNITACVISLATPQQNVSSGILLSIVLVILSCTMR